MMPPIVGKGAISVAFVRPSGRLSVRPQHTQRIIREPKGLACPNLEGGFPTLDATRIPVSRSNSQRLGLEAGGGIPCRPNPAATLLVLQFKNAQQAQSTVTFKNGVVVHMMKESMDKCNAVAWKACSTMETVLYRDLELCMAYEVDVGGREVDPRL